MEKSSASSEVFDASKLRYVYCKTSQSRVVFIVEHMHILLSRSLTVIKQKWLDYLLCIKYCARRYFQEDLILCQELEFLLLVKIR